MCVVWIVVAGLALGVAAIGLINLVQAVLHAYGVF